MMQLASNFLDESNALHELISPLSDADLELRTQFKHWTIGDIIGHLHLWNWAADTTLRDPDRFQVFLADVIAPVQQGKLHEFERKWLNGLRGGALRDAWRNQYRATARHFGQADPETRIAWAGPDMRVRTCISARLMETWAHGQAIYDLLGVSRTDTDRIDSIVSLGVKTFAWSFSNRDLPIPHAPPRLSLQAPSGAIWTFNEESSAGIIEGQATEFCQVVTQVRNVADTHLTIRGDVAERWMANAQCFAGPPESQPPPGSRFRNRETGNRHR